MGYNSTKHNLAALLELINEWVQDNPLKIEELEEYKNWLVDHKLLGKPETEWTDEEMVLWKLTWNN